MYVVTLLNWQTRALATLLLQPHMFQYIVKEYEYVILIPTPSLIPSNQKEFSNFLHFPVMRITSNVQKHKCHQEEKKEISHKTFKYKATLYFGEHQQILNEFFCEILSEHVKFEVTLWWVHKCKIFYKFFRESIYFCWSWCRNLK